MAALNCVEIIERDKDGEVSKVGAEWNENTFYGSPLGVVLRVFGFLGGAIMAIIGAFMLNWASTLPVLGHLLAIITGIPGLILMASVFRKQAKRALLFHRDGTIETPYGIASDKSARIWGSKWKHENVTAIEGVGQDQAWRVDLIYAKGDTVTISSGLDREESRKVAIMLRDSWDAIAPRTLEIS
jgi:hypothetical protein